MHDTPPSPDGPAPLPPAADDRVADPRHRADLESSALTPATWAAAGLYTEPDPQRVAELLGWQYPAKRLGPCLVFPYPALAGGPSGYCRVKPAAPRPDRDKPGKAVKYEAPVGRPPHAYFPALVRERWEGSDPLLLTEGEKKSLCACQHGFPTVGLSGVWAWRRKGEKAVLPELRPIPWSGRVVYVVFDSDRADNPNVRKAEAALAAALRAMGATVRVVALPPGPDGAKTGLDDFFARGGTADGFRELLAAATDPPAGRQSRQPPPPPNPVPYRVEGGRICWERPTVNGVTVVPLCNFTARIAEEVVFDDGAERTRRFEVEGRLADGADLPRAAVTASEFAGLDWVTRCWGVRAVVAAGQGSKDRLREALQHLSAGLQSGTVYAHTGWREVDGTWHYLHAGGAVGPAGPAAGVRVELPAALSRFRLPDPPEGDGLRAAVRESLGLLDLGPDRLLVPVVSAAYRAALGPADLSVFLAGDSGVFKSELAALGQQHFGPDMGRKQLPGHWSDTDNALGVLAFHAKDALLIVDDFAPAGTANDVLALHRKADRLFRGQGNGSGRQRCHADASLRPDKPPRGLVLATGEDVPRGLSCRARLVVLDVRAGDLRADVLTRCQAAAAAGTYAAGLAAFVRWLAPRYGRVRAGLAGEAAGLRAPLADPGGHTRTPANAAELLLGWRYFLEFARAAGAVTEAERTALWGRGAAAMREAAAAQLGHQQGSEPAGQFVRLVRSLVSAGLGHIADRDGAPPPCPERWGWRSDGPAAGPGRDACPRPLGPCLGWAEGAELYLDPDASFAAAQRLARDQGDGFAVTCQTLRKRLKDRGWLESVDDARQKLLVRRTLVGVRRDVLHLDARRVFPTADDPPAGDDPAAAAGASPDRAGEGAGGRPPDPAPAPAASGPPPATREEFGGPGRSGRSATGEGDRPGKRFPDPKRPYYAQSATGRIDPLKAGSPLPPWCVQWCHEGDDRWHPAG